MNVQSDLTKHQDKVNTFLTESIQLSCLPRVKYFGLSISLTWSVYRNVNDEESSLSVGLQRIYISSSVQNDMHMNQKRREEFMLGPRFSGNRQD